MVANGHWQRGSGRIASHLHIALVTHSRWAQDSFEVGKKLNDDANIHHALRSVASRFVDAARRGCALLLLTLVTIGSGIARVGAQSAGPTARLPTVGPGGPILVVTAAANPFSQYYAEILRAEGLNAFGVADISGVSASTLSELRRGDSRQHQPLRRPGHDVHDLGDVGRQSHRHAARQAAGPAAGPDRRRDDTVRRLPAGQHRRRTRHRHRRRDDAVSWGGGSVHRDARRRRSPRCIPTATTATANPAVTVRSVGSAGGQAAAFTYDLARSVVYTRQGNPAWSGQERDGVAPIRSDDLFFGGAQPDYVDRVQDRDPAGGRAAATAGQPHRVHEPAIASRCRGSGTSREARRRSW